MVGYVPVTETILNVNQEFLRKYDFHLSNHQKIFVKQIYSSRGLDITCLSSRKLYKLDEPDTQDCWRSKDELISDVLLWTPAYGQAKAGWPARTYIQQLCEDTGCSPEDLPEVMNDREKWRERFRISVLAARHDGDDDFRTRVGLAVMATKRYTPRYLEHMQLMVITLKQAIGT